MLPSITLFGTITIGLYGSIFIAAFLVAIFVARKIRNQEAPSKTHIIQSAMYALIGMAFGMKLLFFITKLPKFIAGFSRMYEKANGDWSLILPVAGNYLFGGNVFYGGLIGACLGIYIYCRQFKVKLAPLADLYAVMIPFVHGFGRIGCFCAGCCYGREYHGPLAMHFPYNEYIPELSEVPRFPTQLTEAFVNFIMFGVLLYLYKKSKLETGRMIGAYICYYAVFRFIMEFLRGDVVRGGIGILTTSQIVSIILLPIGILIVTGRILGTRVSKRVNGEE